MWGACQAGRAGRLVDWLADNRVVGLLDEKDCFGFWLGRSQCHSALHIE